MKIGNLARRTSGSMGEAVAPLFSSRAEAWSRPASLAWVLAFYGLGLLGWAYILNWGDFPLNFHDWAEGMGHRLAFLRNAVQSGALPLHMPDGSALRNVTDRFVAVPDTVLSPQILLIPWFRLSQFVLFNTLLLYSAGAVGSVWLARRLRISPFVWAAILMLFSFNGHIKDHIIVGHLHWAGYFLLPYYFGWIFSALRGESTLSWSRVLGASLVLALMFLQGAFHLFVMSLIFIGLTMLAAPGRWKELFLAGIFAVSLSMFRILPPALEVGKFDSEFLSGFPSTMDIVQAMVTIRLPFASEVFSRSPLLPLGWWELDHYVGLVGVGFVAYGIVKLIVDFDARQNPWRPLLLPFLLMAALSLGVVYEPINRLGVPLLSSQRVSTRFLIFPLLGLTFLSGERLQRSMDRATLSWRWYLGALLLLGVLLHDLWQHTKLWRVQRMMELFDARFVDFSRATVANHPDPLYHAALIVGVLVAVSGLIFLLLRVARDSLRPVKGTGEPDQTVDSRPPHDR